MSQVSTETPFKYKRRKVSAIRHFPRGCGPNAVKFSPKPAEETTSPLGLENGKVTDTDKVLMASKVVGETIAPSSPALEDKVLMASKVVEETIAPSPPALEDKVLMASKVVEETIAPSPLALEGKVLMASKVVEETITPSPPALEDKVLMASKVVEEMIAPSLPALEEKAPDVPASVEALIPEVEEPPISLTPAVLENNLESNPKTEKLEVQQVMENSYVMKNNVESNSETGKLEVQHLMEESVEPPKLQNRHCHSKMYGPPMRRKVSAIRQFPPGCGPNAGSIKRDNHQPVCVAPNYLNDNSLAREKIYEVNKHLVGDGSIGLVDGEAFGGKMRRNDGKGLVQENGQGVNSESAIRPRIASPKSKTVYADDNMPLAKQSIRIDGSLQVADVESSLNRDKSMMKQATTIAGSAKLSSSKKVGVADRKDSKVTKGKEITIDKGVLVRSNSDKNFRVQGTSGHVQIKSSLKSGSNEKSLLKSRSNELSVRSSFDKSLEGCKVDQSVKNIQNKANASKPSHLAVKSHSGNERLDERGMPLMEKHIGKENEIDQNSSKKRKLPEDIPYKDYIPGERDDSLASIEERMIIQALMAGKNCPWRNPRRRSVVSSDFIVPKSKIRKEKRFVDKNPASKDFFPSQQKSKDLIEDDDNTLEEDNELSITMTPFVPRESIHKDGDNEEVMVRHKVKRALRLFQLICRKLLQGEESRSKRSGKINRIDLQASAMLKDNGEWVNSGEPIIGNVPGVEIGDEFHFRVELSIVGLHRPFQGGIDCTKKNGMLLATSIVASGGYQDDMDSSDVLIYSGSGGTTVVGRDKQPSDQKLERGNLALRNSIDTETPVRVIHGFKEKGSDPYDAKGKMVSTFTYDGLYQVESYWQEIGSHGFNVFKFQLRRKAGQPELAHKELKRSAKLKIREGLCVKDISQGKEKMPISVVNTIDTDQPMPFKYITKNIYPSWYVKTPPRGCDCTNGCSDSERCACAVKNGGEIPFNFNGAIVQAKPLIYECGPSCKCFISCHNRVSQRGIRMQLEIFKTRGRGWGVRSLKSISSGSFICEYIGELLQDGEAEQRTNDEYLFDIGHNYDDRSLWEDLPNLIPGLQSSSQCDTVESVGFTIDAAEYGNVGRFINHSCSPNLYAQNVLYDHDDKRMPHIMFFAVDNIPPLQELTYHYNYTIDQVHDSEGNIKQKACHCGSPECCGRLY